MWIRFGVNDCVYMSCFPLIKSKTFPRMKPKILKSNSTRISLNVNIKYCMNINKFSWGWAGWLNSGHSNFSLYSNVF